MIFVDFQTEVKFRIKKARASTDVNTMIKRWINGGVFKVYRANNWKSTQREDTLTLDASTESYNLPFDFDRPAFIYQEEFGYRYPVGRLSERQFTDFTPTDDEEGDVFWYRLWQERGVDTQITTGATLEVVSSSAADTLAKGINIRVEGIVEGLPDAEDFTINGITAVPGSKTFTRIDRITKSITTTGRITISDGTTTFATLPVGLISNTLNRKRISFRFIPDSSDTITLGYYARPFQMVNNNDIHGLGDEFDEAIMLWAVYLGRDFAKDPTFETLALQAYRNEIRDLRSWNNETTAVRSLRLWDSAHFHRFARFSGGYWPHIG